MSKEGAAKSEGPRAKSEDKKRGEAPGNTYALAYARATAPKSRRVKSRVCRPGRGLGFTIWRTCGAGESIKTGAEPRVRCRNNIELAERATELV